MTEFVWHEQTRCMKAICGHMPGRCALNTAVIHSSYWMWTWNQLHAIKWCVSNTLNINKPFPFCMFLRVHLFKLISSVYKYKLNYCIQCIKKSTVSKQVSVGIFQSIAVAAESNNC